MSSFYFKVDWLEAYWFLVIFSKNQLLVSLIFWYWFLVFNFTDFCSHCFSSYAYFGFTLLFFRLLIFGLYSFLIYALKWYKSPFLFLSLTNFGKLHFHSAQNILIFLLRFLLWCMYLSSMYFGISSLFLCGLKADILWFFFLSFKKSPGVQEVVLMEILLNRIKTLFLS